MEAEAERRLDELEARLGFRFKQRELLREAMTHTSWINERGVAGRDNERLEYLGDAVLELVAGEYLFKRFPGYDEGQLTQIRSSLVSTVALARLGEELRLGETLRLGKGAAKSGARRLTSLHANAFEALVGATFLDQGYRRAGRIFLSRIGDLSAWTDPNFKGRLQAVAQEKLGGPPQYRTGPVGQDARSRQYLSQVSVEGHGTLGEGRGGTKQAAEQAAARLALEKLMAPAPKRRRGRGAASLAAATVPPQAEPSTLPSTPSVAQVPGEEADLPRRKRRRSRSRPAVDLLTPEVPPPQPSAPEPLGIQVSPGGADPAASPSVAQVSGEEAGPPRRKRRRSRSRPAAEPAAAEFGSPGAPATHVSLDGPTVGASEAAGPAAGEETSSPRGRRRRSRSRPVVEHPEPEPDVAAAARPGPAEGQTPDASGEEAAGHRRRRRSRSRSSGATGAPPDSAVEAVAARPPVAGTASAEAAGAAPSRRVTRRRAAAGLSGQAARDAPTPAPEPGRAGSAPGSEAAAPELAAGPEGAVAARRTRRGHRGGRHRTKVVVSGPE